MQRSFIDVRWAFFISRGVSVLRGELLYVWGPADAPGGVHNLGRGSGLPVREDFLIIRTFFQRKLESSPSPEVFK